MPRQYVRCSFGNSAKLFTYHNDEAPVAVGALVDVVTPNGATVPVEVKEVTDEQPPFATKPIVGISSTEAI
jgi:hypothetical protein